MADLDIPREAVEAGARACLPETWDITPSIAQHMMRETAMAVLNAAAPLIVAAELDRIAHDVDTTKTPDDSDYMTAFKAGQRWFKTILREHADLLRAQT